MRFFSGTRSSSANGKNKVSASKLYKASLDKTPKPEKTQDEKYKEMIEAKIAKLTEDAMMGIKKGGFRMPGTKQDAPKEMSKNAKMMMKLLAMQKLQKDAKVERKKLKEMMWAEKAQKKAKALAKAIEEDNIAYQKRLEEEAAAAAAMAAAETHTSTSSYWGVGPSSSDDSGNGWW